VYKYEFGEVMQKVQDLHQQLAQYEEAEAALAGRWPAAAESLQRSAAMVRVSMLRLQKKAEKMTQEK